MEHVSYESKKLPNQAKDLSEPHQDGEYFSGKIMDCSW